MNAELKYPPRVHLLQSSRSLTAVGKPNPTGGRYGAGMIPDVSLCFRGEALGHNTWIDGLMPQRVAGRKRWQESFVKTGPETFKFPRSEC